MKKIIDRLQIGLSAIFRAISFWWTTRKKNERVAIFSLCALFFLAVNVCAYLIGTGTITLKKKFRSVSTNALRPSPTPIPTPTPRPLRTHGKVTFSISGSVADAPTFKNGYLDPIDPPIGEIQTIGMWISDDTAPTSQVIAHVLTDTKKTDVPMRAVETKGKLRRWEGFWRVSDTYLYTYQVIVEAKNERNSDSVTTTWK